MVQNTGKLWQGETSLPCFSAIRHPYYLIDTIRKTHCGHLI